MHERQQGRRAAVADIRQAITKLLRQGDAEIGPAQFAAAYRAELERQCARL